MAPAQDRVRAFEAKQVADWQCERFFMGRVLPARGVRFDLRPVAELRHLAALLHRAVIRELPLGVRPRLLRAAPAGEIVKTRRIAGDLRRDDDSEPTAPQLGKTDRIARAVTLSIRRDELRGQFAAADIFLRPTL